MPSFQTGARGLEQSFGGSLQDETDIVEAEAVAWRAGAAWQRDVEQLSDSG